ESHRGDFTGALPGEQQNLERAGIDAGVFKRGPEQRHFAVAEDALAARGLVAVDAAAGIGRQDLLLHRPTEDGAGASADLVREDGGLRASIALTSARPMLGVCSLPQVGMR